MMLQCGLDELADFCSSVISPSNWADARLQGGIGGEGRGCSGHRAGWIASAAVAGAAARTTPGNNGTTPQNHFQSEPYEI